MVIIIKQKIINTITINTNTKTINTIKLKTDYNLRHSFSIPKLLYVLRTSPCFSSSLLISWDNLLMSIVSRITNIEFRRGDPAWLQATLPVNSGGLGFRSASGLAPSVFLASTDRASVLMHQLLPAQLVSTPYRKRDSALSAWKIDLPVEISPPEASNRQKAWDEPKVAHLLDTLLAQCNDQVSRARLLAAGCSESGAWLNAPPVSLLGLRMSNGTVHIAIGLRVGAPLCLAHECCSCGTPVWSPRPKLQIKSRKELPPSIIE